MTDETRAGDGKRFVPRSASEALRSSAAPPPPKRTRSRAARNQVIVFFNFLFSAVLFVALVAIGVVFWGKATFEAAGPLNQQTTFLIPKNSSLNAIATNLEDKGIISDARLFEAGVRISGVAGDLKAGEYAFAPASSMRSVMEKLRNGSSILHTLTIPEGWTVKQIFDRIAADDVLSGPMPPMPGEGTLLPETYKYTRGMTRAEMVAKMSAAQADLVAEIWARRNREIPVRDIGEFVTLASIVEKETGRADERPMVAAVFMNRLKNGMRLQSDPTIIYGIWGGAGKPADEPIRQSHIKGETPYNTYVIKGLPPGPIANPGRAALEAVANPSSTQDVYFVADGTGGHVFAKTLDEHNANVRRYRKIEGSRDDGASPEVGAATAAP